MSDIEKTPGLLIRPINRYGTHYLEVEARVREGDIDAPLGCCVYDQLSWLRGKGDRKLRLDGLGVRGFFTRDNLGKLTGNFVEPAPDYRDVYVIEREDAERMLRTLKRYERTRQQMNAYESGDRFVALAKTIGAQWACHDRNDKMPPNGMRYRFMSVLEGRNLYRNLIEQGRQRTGEEAA